MNFSPLSNVYRDDDHIEKQVKRPLDDTTLAAAAARGDQEAFEALFERDKWYVYKLSYKIAELLARMDGMLEKPQEEDRKEYK